MKEVCVGACVLWECRQVRWGSIGGVQGEIEGKESENMDFGGKKG